MAYDFPTSPTAGQEFTPPGGPTYVWVSPRWIAKSGATAQRLNRICNPNMCVSQENGSASSAASGYYAADQWVNSYATGGNLGFGRLTGTTTPNGSKYSLGANVNTADAAVAAGDVWMIFQPIEGVRVADFGWGAAGARQVIVRFCFYGPAGTYCTSVQNATLTRSYIANFTITAGQAGAWTTQTFVIPGDTTGTWPTDTGVGMYLEITLAAGTTYQGAAGWSAGGFYATSAISNGMASTSNSFGIGDVGLYLDPLATGVAPPWEMPDYAQELLACMRYYEKHPAIPTVYCAFHASVWASHYFKVPKRIQPAMTFIPSSPNGGGPQVDTFQFSGMNNSTYTFGYTASARM